MAKTNQTFTLFILLFISCGQNNQTSSATESSAPTDSITLERQKEHAIKDSIVQLDQGKVIGEILFGMTKKEFEKKKSDFMQKCKVVDWVGSDGYKFYKYEIGGYRFTDLWADYYNQKLHFVQIQGDLIHYEKYKSEMVEQSTALYQVYKNKYGEAIENNGIPEWHRTEKGYSYLVAFWLIGTKKIEIRVENDGIYYRLNVNIYQPEISKQIEIEKADKEKKAAQKATDLL